MTPDGHPARVLVVCYGNHCRSPLAAAVLGRRGSDDVEVRSASIHPRWVDKPAHPLMIQAADRHGYDLTAHRGRLITTEDIQWAEAILCMDQRNMRDLERLVGPEHTAKLALILGDTEIPDPWGDDPAVFAASAELIVNGVQWPLR